MYTHQVEHDRMYTPNGTTLQVYLHMPNGAASSVLYRVQLYNSTHNINRLVFR